MATFVFKVLTLAIKTASKPLANRFQSYVLAHPTLRPAVLRFAQGLHGVEFALARFAEGKSVGSAKKFIATLDDERAMELAGKAVSEGFVLAVAVGILGWEYNRNSKKDAAKRAKDEAFRGRVNESFDECRKQIASLAEQHRAIIAALQARQEQLDHRMQEMELKDQPSRSAWGLSWALRSS